MHTDLDLSHGDHQAILFGESPSRAHTGLLPSELADAILSQLPNRDIESRPEHVARAKQLAALLPLREPYAHYQKLLRQQDEVLSSGADADALENVLKQGCFLNLRRITITPLARGFLFTPFYETPMVRNLPYSFTYPVPRSCPTPKNLKSSCIWPWMGKTRGFHIVTRLLARYLNANVTEVIVETNRLKTGLPCDIFDGGRPCEEYKKLVAAPRRAGFSRLDLALTVEGQDIHHWSCFRNGRLRNALTTDLERVSLQTDVEANLDVQMDALGTGGSLEHFIPLQTIFPVEAWPRWLGKTTCSDFWERCRIRSAILNLAFSTS